MNRGLVWIALALGVGVFCVVQDRVTAAGARWYVALQRAALEGREPAVTIDEVMRPAISRSVRLALLSGGGVVVAGLGAGVMVRNARSHRKPNA